MTVPEDLTPEALFKWQDQLEADLERVLLENAEEALSAIVSQAVSYDLTAASARFLWEGAVDKTLLTLGLSDDQFLRADLLEELIGDDAYVVVQEVLARRLPREQLTSALYEALELSPSLLASGTFWSEDNWIEQTGTGHLPPYIRDIADALMEQGYDESRAIATAVNTVKRWAKGGPARQGGPGHVTKETQAKAIRALVEWEAKRIEARATSLHKPTRGTMEDKTLEHQKALGLGQFALMLPEKTVLKWKTRIKRVARTAFTGVANRAILGILRVRGAKFKTWVTKRDDRVRLTHQDAEGQTVPIDEYFRVGNESLMYPGEHGKAIAEIANCRCIIVPG